MSEFTEQGLFVGYDAKIAGTSAFVDAGFRNKHLFKFDIADVCSVDTGVWPSAFDMGDKGVSLERPQYVGPVGSLWSDIDLLLMDVLPMNDVDAIAVKVILHRQSSAIIDRWEKRVETVQPALKSPPWRLLGYDVADEYLTSSLCNCGLGELRAVLKLGERPVADKLNNHHLFEDVRYAEDFVLLSN